MVDLNLAVPEAVRRTRAALRNDDKARTSWFRITNKDDGSAAEVYIYDEIAPFWGISASDFVHELAAITSDKITVHINSPGGDVWDGIAILNALRGHKAKVTTVVDSIAASIASIIAMAGDEVVMNRNSEMMIHEPRAICIGTSTDMADYATHLERTGDNLASIYAEKAGGEAKDWRKAMTAETWYTAQEAVDAGLADALIEPKTEEPDVAAKNIFDLSLFNYAGRSAAPRPAAIAGAQSPHAAEAEATQRGKEGAMPTLNEGLAERLGVAADADDETILAAVDEALQERAEEDPAAAAGAQAEPSPEQIAAAAARMGLAVVDQSQWETVRSEAAAGRAARERQTAEDHQRIVNDAIDKGKIPPHRREHWLASMAADAEGATATLATLQPGLIPVNELGHASGGGPDSGQDGNDLGWFNEAPKEA